MTEAEPNPAAVEAAMQRWLATFDGMFEELARRGNSRQEVFNLLTFLGGRLQERTLQVPFAPYVQAQMFDYMALYIILQVVRGVPMFGQRALTEQLKRQARETVESSPKIGIKAPPPAEPQKPEETDDEAEAEAAMLIAQTIGGMLEGKPVDVVLTALRGVMVQTIINLEVDKGSKFKGDDFLDSVRMVVDQARAVVAAQGARH